MKLSVWNIFILPLVFQGISQASGTISVSCGSRNILIFVKDMPLELRRLKPTGFFIGKRESRCYADINSRVVIQFPFRRCDTEATLYEDGVVYNNTMFVVSEVGKAEKYAEFQCQYGNTNGVGTIIEPRGDTSFNKSNRSLVRDVTLCNSLRFCPNHPCPSSRKVLDHSVFFADNVMHISILTYMKILAEKQANVESVSAIERLSIDCIDESKSPELQFQSVVNGCYARKPFDYNHRTVTTQINYNAQSRVVCMSVDVPPVDLCKKFVISGIVVRCLKTDEKICDGYSGSRCSRNETSEPFTLGPFYVAPKTKVKSVVKSVYRPAGATTSILQYLTRVADATAADERTTRPEDSAVSKHQNVTDWNIISVVRSMPSTFRTTAFPSTDIFKGESDATYATTHSISTVPVETKPVKKLCDSSSIDTERVQGALPPTVHNIFVEPTPVDVLLNPPADNVPESPYGPTDTDSTQDAPPTAPNIFVEPTPAEMFLNPSVENEPPTETEAAQDIPSTVHNIVAEPSPGEILLDPSVENVHQSVYGSTDKEVSQASPLPTPHNIFAEPTPNDNFRVTSDIETSTTDQLNEIYSLIDEEDYETYFQARNFRNRPNDDAPQDVDYIDYLFYILADRVSANHFESTEYDPVAVTSSYYDSNQSDGSGEAESGDIDELDADVDMNTRLQTEIFKGLNHDDPSTSVDVITRSSIRQPTLQDVITSGSSAITVTHALSYDQVEDDDRIFLDNLAATSDVPPAKGLIESPIEFDAIPPSEGTTQAAAIDDPSDVREPLANSAEHNTVKGDVRLDELKPPAKNIGRSSFNRPCILPKNGLPNTQTPVTPQDFSPTDNSHDFPGSSNITDGEWDDVLATARNDTNGNVKILEASNGRVRKPKSLLRYFDEYEANEGFIWAGLSALGVFLICSIALTAAWAVNRRNVRKRNREWLEVSSRL